MADDEIVFLGTGGARIVVATQLRATGGILFYLDKKLILVDPGPGSLLRFLQYGKPHRINKLDAIILTHRHIDHSSDINVIIDALTEGGKKRKGSLFAPADALFEDPVVLKYHQTAMQEIVVIKPKLAHPFNSLRISFPLAHQHGVETYGIVFRLPNYTIGHITDTDYFEGLKKHYHCDILIINVLRPEPSEFPHLSVDEVKKIITKTRPKLAIITHFGMMMIRKNPFKIAQEISSQTKIKVLAAKDGLKISPKEYLNG